MSVVIAYLLGLALDEQYYIKTDLTTMRRTSLPRVYAVPETSRGP